MTVRNLSLYIPDLFGPAPSPQQPQWLELAKDGFVVPVLEGFLSRASRRTGAVDSLTQLCDLFALSRTDVDLPIAAITRAVDIGVSENAYWLRADPVHVKPDRDRIVMFGNQHLTISAEESAQIAAEFNALYKEDGVSLETPTSLRWYLRLEKDPGIKTVPLENVIGQDIHPCLPTGDEAMVWHRFLNEVQMMLHASRVNEQRRHAGQPEINSLWLWGGGTLPAITQTKWQAVWSNETLSRGLAELSNTSQHSLPASADDWLEQANTPGEHLVVMNALADAVVSKDVAGWCRMLQAMEDDWLQPLLEGLKTGALNNVTILTNGAAFSANAKMLRRWWKRHKILQQFV